MLTKEQILGTADRQVSTLTVPEWDGDVCLRRMTAEESQQYRLSGLNNEFKLDRVKTLRNHLTLAALTLCDESGARMFTPDELADKSAAAIERIAAEARKVNGLNPTSDEDSEKN